MAANVDNGKGFEYFCYTLIKDRIIQSGSNLQDISTVLDNNEKCYMALSDEAKNDFESCSQTLNDLVDDILGKYGYFDTIRAMADYAGSKGDVRDAAITRDKPEGKSRTPVEVGFSFKHNNPEIKSIRFNTGKNYQRVFGIRKLENGKPGHSFESLSNWPRDVDMSVMDKGQQRREFLEPHLKAFTQEFFDFMHSKPFAFKNFARFLFGKHSYYKISFNSKSKVKSIRIDETFSDVHTMKFEKMDNIRFGVGHSIDFDLHTTKGLYSMNIRFKSDGEDKTTGVKAAVIIKSAPV